MVSLLTVHVMMSLLRPCYGSEYCDASVCLFVCPRAYLRNNPSELTKLLRILPMAVAWSSFSGMPICLYFRLHESRHVFRNGPYDVVLRSVLKEITPLLRRIGCIVSQTTASIETGRVHRAAGRGLAGGGVCDAALACLLPGCGD